jgi:putative flippase GtrA
MRKHIQFLRFCLVGTAGLLVNLAVTFVAVSVFGVWYFWAYLCGVLCGWTASFVFNAFFTFPEHRRGSYIKKYTLFVATYAVILALNSLMVYGLTSLVGVQYLISITISALLTTLLSFSLSKRIIYTTT